MNPCEEYLELISGGVDSGLDEFEAVRLNTHLETCEACRAVYEFYSLLDENICDMSAEPPEKLVPGVMSLLKTEKKSKNIFNRFAFRSFTAIAAAACVVIFVASRYALPDNKLQLSSYNTRNNAPAMQDTALYDGGTEEDTQAAPPPNAPAGSEEIIPEISARSFGVEAGETESAEPPRAEIKAAATAAPETAAGFATVEENNGPPVMFGEGVTVIAPDDASFKSAASAVIALHPGEFAKALLFREKPLGLGSELNLVSDNLNYYIVTADSFDTIAEINKQNSVSFQFIESDSDANLSPTAESCVVIVLEN